MPQTRAGALKVRARKAGLTPEEVLAKEAAGLKWCYGCRSWIHTSAFSTDNSRADGFAAQCRTCKSQRTQPGPSLIERREKAAQGLAYCRGCKAWHQAAEVRGGACGTCHARFARERYATDETYRRERRQHAHARKRGVAPVPAAAQEALLELFDGACAYCPSPATTWDHVVPISKGGTTRPSNIVPACHSCNSSKADRDVMDWVAHTNRQVKPEFFDLIDLVYV